MLDLLQKNKVVVSLEKVIHYLNRSMMSELISIKVHMVNISDFMSHMVSISTITTVVAIAA